LSVAVTITDIGAATPAPAVAMNVVDVVPPAMTTEAGTVRLVADEETSATLIPAVGAGLVIVTVKGTVLPAATD
jgi:hypothetical protein